MKFVITTLLFLGLILITTSEFAFADKIQGHFFCESKYPDGSGGKFTIKVNGSKMTVKDVGYDIITKYKELYYADFYREEFTVFVMSENNDQAIYILSPIENTKDRISTTRINTSDYQIKSMIAQGTCDRI